MLVVAKMPLTGKKLFEVRGNIPSDLLEYLKDSSGFVFDVVDDEDELVDIFETDWFRNISPTLTPGVRLKVYRENSGLSQAQWGAKLGGLSRQKVSDMERGKRGISKDLIKRIGKVFNVPIGGLL